MRYKKLIIILLVLFVSSIVLFIFWQRSGKLIKTGPKEFKQLYVAEIPAKSVYLADGASVKFYEALQSEAGIIVQNPENILPGLLQIFDVQYVLLRDEKYWEIFDPFLDYSSEEEKEDLPRTFPVKKEVLGLSSEPFLVLGEGWHGSWKNEYGVAGRSFGEEAIIIYVIPSGTLDRAPEFLSFLVPWSIFPDQEKKTKIEVMVNGKTIYSSDSYQWTTLKLSNLREGINEIKLRSSRGCMVPEGDELCISFSIQQVELFSLQNIPAQGLARLDRFMEIEKGEYWMGSHASVRVFTPHAVPPSLITLQIQAASGEPRKISIIEKDKEIDRIIIFGKEPQKITLLTYQQGENIFYFASDDCEEKIIEGQEICVIARIKDFQIEPVE